MHQHGTTGNALIVSIVLLLNVLLWELGIHDHFQNTPCNHPIFDSTLQDNLK